MRAPDHDDNDLICFEDADLGYGRTAVAQLARHDASRIAPGRTRAAPVVCACHYAASGVAAGLIVGIPESDTERRDHNAAEPVRTHR